MRVVFNSLEITSFPFDSKMIPTHYWTLLASCINWSDMHKKLHYIVSSLMNHLFGAW